MRRLARRSFGALTSNPKAALLGRCTAALATLGAFSFALAGCPIFDDHNSGPPYGCPYPPCNPGSECTSTLQCGVNEVCGVDRMCHVGDCTHWGCASGECVVNDDLTATCDSGSGQGGSGQGGSGQGGSGQGGSGQGGSTDVVGCGNPDDCSASQSCAPNGTCQDGDCSDVGCIFGYACSGSSGRCEPTSPAACTNDAGCATAGAGYACVNGTCTAPADQCFDQGQCGPNEKCAGGKCAAACTTGTDCGPAFTCDATLGVCTAPRKACAITGDCGALDEVCVDGACVPRSDDGVCGAAEVWVANGCIPDQSATFACTVDGQQDACAAGSLCLHRGCYVSCEPPNETACDALQLNLCKAIVSGSGVHQVCGSSTTLGNDCNPQVGAGCGAGEVCLNGYCK